MSWPYQRKSRSMEFPVENLDPSKMPNIRKALANVRSNLGPARIAIVGDSVVTGYGANAGATYSASRLWNMQHFLATILTARGLPAHDNNFFVDHGQGVSVFLTGDPRITTGATPYSIADITTVTGSALAPQNTQATPITDNYLAFAPGVVTTGIDLYYCEANAPTRQVTNGTLTVLSEGTHVNGLPARTNAIQRVPYAAVSGTNTYYVTKTTSPTLRVMGIDTYNSAAYAASIWNLGRPGTKSADYLVTTGDYSEFYNVSSMQPDLCIYQVPVINDVGNGTSIATFTANVQAYITQILSTGLTDMALAVDNPLRIDGGSLGLQRTYCEAVRGLAYNNNLPFIDINARWVSQEIGNALGYYADDRHPRDRGYADIASAYAQLLLAL